MDHNTLTLDMISRSNAWTWSANCSMSANSEDRAVNIFHHISIWIYLVVSHTFFTPIWGVYGSDAFQACWTHQPPARPLEHTVARLLRRWAIWGTVAMGWWCWWWSWYYFICWYPWKMASWRLWGNEIYETKSDEWIFMKIVHEKLSAHSGTQVWLVCC